MVGDSYWGGERVERVHPRLTAELLLDSIEFHDEPATLFKHLKDAGYSPSFVRSKGYVGQSGDQVVLVLPFVSDDLESVAGLSVNRSLDLREESAGANATIVNMMNGTRPRDFTVLTVERGELQSIGPTSFDALRTDGVRAVAARLATDRDRPDARTADARVSKGRAIAAAALEDLTREEADVGFISQSELQTVLRDTELYADIARVHSYLAATSEAKAAAGCSYCTSTSSYACTSSSCMILSSSQLTVNDPIRRG
jgi:hypothetical protein